MNDYKAKIKKLLSLSKSTNEHEAQAALLKAKQLMAEHKISEADFRNMNEEIEYLYTDVSYTKRKNIWIMILADLIAENYCCQNFVSRQKHAQTRIVAFVGLANDVHICKDVFTYAIDFICARQKEIRKTSIYKNSSPKFRKILEESYGFGFTEGLRNAFQEQKERHSVWGLVMVQPNAVVEAVKKMKHNTVGKESYDIDPDLFRKVVKDGEDFVNVKKIQDQSGK